MSDSRKLGAFLVLAFLIMANANAVFSGWLLQSVPPFTLLFWGFLITTLFFFVRLSVSQGVAALKIPRASLMGLITLNLASGISWIGYYCALKFIEPAIVSALMGCIGPLFILMVGFISQRRISINQVITSAGIIAGTAVLSWASIADRSAVQNVAVNHVLLGLGAAFIGGFGQVLTTLSTKKLANQNWSASQIMAHRFYLLTAVAAVVALNSTGLLLNSPAGMVSVGTVSVLGILVPLWLLQKGIIISSPFTVSVLLSLGPLMTLLFQGFDSRLLWSNMSVVGCGIIVLSTLNNFAFSQKAPQISRTNSQG
ncbi:DMT family transporter [Stenoxybacter acetivorans]|uniref:DMT family transporter n=1 Tax=Stenoxybacter acetivorans TaxID=422441 RepID=UPI00068F0B86|nr:DMT family transporter [Stenoxybacter acetivorans]